MKKCIKSSSVYRNFYKGLQRVKKTMEISIATFNVHMWMDGEFEPNYQRVLDLVKVRVMIHSIRSKYEELFFLLPKECFNFL